MDSQWDAIFMYANTPSEHPYLPDFDTSVFISGSKYSCSNDRSAIADHLRSLFWMTYRKGFPPILTQTGPTSDAGWGCMHRCGQMMLAEAISRILLGPDWRWTPNCHNDAYAQQRRMFQDHKGALYSIHNIAMLGLALDKSIGSWFGPNTAAQVIKKLCAYDSNVNWYVHISVEDGVISDEIKVRCLNVGPPRLHVSSLPSLSMLATPSADGTDNDWNLEAIKAHFAEDAEVIESPPHIHGPITRDLDEDCLEVVMPPTYDWDRNGGSVTCDEPIPVMLESVMSKSVPAPDKNDQTRIHRSSGVNGWRPLILFIPLRLGLHQSNPCYFSAIKAVLKLPHCIGILGGRPSHAVWIVGTVGNDDVLCLDPHVTQPASQEDLTAEDDLTHHCDSPCRLPLRRLDPSMVLGFCCPTEAAFDDLCTRLEREVLGSQTSCGHPLFEMHKTRPFNLPPMPALVVPRSKKSLDLSNQDATDVCPSSGLENETESNVSISQEGKFGEALGAIRVLWSKCNQVAENTVRTLANLRNHATGTALGWSNRLNGITMRLRKH